LLPARIKNHVTFVEQMIQYRADDGSVADKYENPDEVFPGQTIGLIDMNQWVEFLLQHQMTKGVQGYRLCEKSIFELKKMLRLVKALGSDSERYHQSELLTEVFHKMAECGVMKVFRDILIQDSLPTQTSVLTCAYLAQDYATAHNLAFIDGPITNGYTQIGSNPLLYSSTLPLQVQILKFLDHFIRGPQIPDLPTDDDNHPSNYFYKRKVQTEGLVDGMYHLLDFGKMDTLLAPSSTGVYSQEARVLDALSNLHRPAQALVEAHVKHTSTLYDFATQQHILVQTSRSLSDFVLSPTLYEAWSKSPKDLAYGNLVRFASHLLDVQEWSWRVLGTMASDDEVVRDWQGLQKLVFYQNCQLQDYGALTKYLSSRITEVQLPEPYPRIYPTAQHFVYKIYAGNGLRQFSMGVLFREQVDISQPTHSRAKIEYVRLMCNNYKKSVEILNDPQAQAMLQQQGMLSGDIMSQLAGMQEGIWWMDQFVELSERVLGVDEQALRFMSRMVGETTETPPNWIRETQHDTHRHQLTEIAKLAGSQLTNSDDPRVLTEVCLSAAHIVPALSAVPSIGRAQCHELVKMLLERLLGCALATLCMQDPNRDSKKRGFNGAAGNDDRTARMRLRQGYHIEDSYDGADMLISTRLGVWCPRVHLEIDPGTMLPCADPPNANSPVAMQQVENDRKSAAEYLGKAPSMHRKVLRALLQLLEPTLVVYFTEELSGCGPNDVTEKAQFEQAIMNAKPAPADLKLILERFMPYLYEVLENEQMPGYDGGNDIELRRLALSIIEKIISLVTTDAVYVLTKLESRLLPYLLLLIHQVDDEPLRWGALRIIKTCAEYATQDQAKELVQKGCLKTLCSTLRHFKTYNEQLIELYQQVKPSFNTGYVLDALEAVLRFSALLIGTGVDGIDFYGLDNIKALAITMQNEQDFWASKYEANADLIDRVHQVIVQLQQPPNANSTLERVIYTEKHRVLEQIKDILRSCSEKQTQATDEIMGGQHVLKRPQVQFLVEVFFPAMRNQQAKTKTIRFPAKPVAREMVDMAYVQSQCGQGTKLDTLTKPYLKMKGNQQDYKLWENLQFNDDVGEHEVVTLLTQDDLDRALAKFDRAGAELERQAAYAASQQNGNQNSNNRIDDPIKLMLDLGENQQGYDGYDNGQRAGLNQTQRHMVISDLQNTTNMSRAQLMSVIDRFEEIRKDGSQDVLSRNDFTREIRKILGIRPQMANKLFDAFDSNNDGSISVTEFAVGLIGLNNNATEEDKLKFLFRFYDNDKSGNLDRTELRQLLIALFSTQERPPDIDQLVEKFVSSVDSDGDGLISMREFLAIARDPSLSDIRNLILEHFQQQFVQTGAQIIEAAPLNVQGANRPICQHYANGNCRFGASCRDRHDDGQGGQWQQQGQGGQWNGNQQQGQGGQWNGNQQQPGG